MLGKLPGQQQAVALVVDTDIAVAAELRAAIEALGQPTIAVSDFQAARRELRGRELNAVVANLRLGPFNGIHLAYAAKHAHPEMRVIIYAQQHDQLLAREAQRAGAFYERLALVPYVIGRFLGAALPTADRRDAATPDRRTSFRGGRRISDMSSLHSMAAI
jgi:DNA-binding NtrC family response regulator